MTRWVVVRVLGVTPHRPPTWAVVKERADGTREEPRARWSNLSCLDAQVLAAELERAYDLGWDEGRKALADMFRTPLGD